jgi:C-terminal processing protease CtpA/Prc
MIKKSQFLFIIILYFQLISCWENSNINLLSDTVYENIIKPTTFYPVEFNEQGRIYYYAKIFGLIKFCASKKNSDNINTRFIENYEIVKNASNREHFNRIIISILSLSKSNSDNINNTNIDWLHNSYYFDVETTNIIISICNYYKEEKNPYLTQNHLGLVEVRDKDRPYDFDSLYPCEATRIWSIANYWNYVNYFWVYKPLIDANWDSVLYMHIPDFISANDAKEYNLAVMKLTARTNDSHAVVRSKVIDEKLFGMYVPNFRMKKINDTFVVTKYRTNRNHVLSDTLIKPGDIIYALNGMPIIKLYDSLKIYFASSNEWIESKNVAPWLLSSFMENNQIVFSRNNTNDTIEVVFSNYYDFIKYDDSINRRKRNQLFIEKRDQTSYVYIDNIYSCNFNKTIKELRQAKNIILDMRSYPNNNISILLMNNLLPPQTIFFKYMYPDIHNIGFLKEAKGYAVGKKHVFADKRIVILVNEETQSEAEFLVMALQQLENVVTIGNHTAGADGNVIFWDFPGKIRSALSGIGIIYPDNTATQRKGVKIDYVIEPTVKDYQIGKDPILEFAYSFLQ